VKRLRVFADPAWRDPDLAEALDRIEELEAMLGELLEAEEFDTIEFAKVKDKACKVLGVENVWR
jgi:hypothetical protein